MENTAQGGVPSDKYSMRLSALFIARHAPSAVFFVHTSLGGALSGILYFELLLSCKRLLQLCTKLKWSGQVKRWI